MKVKDNHTIFDRKLKFDEVEAEKYEYPLSDEYSVITDEEGNPVDINKVNPGDNIRVIVSETNE